jgi:hypothetical protein
MIEAKQIESIKNFAKDRSKELVWTSQDHDMVWTSNENEPNQTKKHLMIEAKINRFFVLLALAQAAQLIRCT